MKNILFLLLGLMLVTACTTAQPEPTSTPLPPTESPPPSDTSVPPTQVPQPIEVIFDGNGCKVTGPTEVLVGEYIIKFIQEIGLRGELYVEHLDDGKTTQDSLDLQTEPGEYIPQPSFAHHISGEPFESEDSEGIRVVTSTWNFYKVGAHNILCYVGSPQQKLWFYGPIMVVEALSD